MTRDIVRGRISETCRRGKHSRCRDPDCRCPCHFVGKVRNEIVDIPFDPEMAKAALEGRKCCTSRSKAYGKPGDSFPIDGTLFVLEDVSKRLLEDVAFQLYREEGFATPQGFIDTWDRLHPGKGFQPEKTVYTHWFQRAEALI